MHEAGHPGYAAGQSALSPLVAAARKVPGGSTAANAPPPVVGSALGQSHEQEWIVADVLTTLFQQLRPGQVMPPLRVTVEGDGWMHGVTIGTSAPARLPVVGHVWAPATYVPPVRNLLPASAASAPAGEDLAVRAALVDLRPAVLVAQDRLVSARLRQEPWSASAHEAAALIVGAFALREGPGAFGDSRRELSLMTAHLAIAQALRGARPEGRDGTVARAVHAALAGLQREALTMVSSLEGPGASPADGAWVRALTLRLTGDWRAPMHAADVTRLEQYEHARALTMRVGASALLDWLDTFAQDDDAAWHRIALGRYFGKLSLEASAIYSRVAVDRELGEVQQVWALLHDQSRLTDGDVVAALNRTMAVESPSSGATSLLPWPRWAAAAQRHVASALEAAAHHLYMLGDPDGAETLLADATARFSGLTLFPLILRSLATDPASYAHGMRESRRLVSLHPELITAATWNRLTEPPRFAAPVESFPLLQAWMHPVVPTGSAYDLYARALLPGCPRTPPIEQLRIWLKAQPYEQWTIWSSQWLPVTGKPAFTDVLKAYGALLDYDANANRHAALYLDMPVEPKLEVTRRLCALSEDCERYTWLLMWDGRDREAAVAYEDWIERARDRLGPANELEWLARYYVRHGRHEDALRVATFAGSTGSGSGLVTLAETLSSLGRDDEALRIYERIATRYRDRVPLGTHRLRMALRGGDRDARLAAMTDLQAVFPRGLETLSLHGLDATPIDGVRFGPLGRRGAAVGVRQDDIVVGLDEWRVRTWGQYQTLMDVRHDRAAVTLTVFRAGRYQQLRLTMPERKMGVGLFNVEPRP